MPLPKIKTAIPKRRYQFGEYLVTLLGEISSDDAISYQFITAIVKEGDTQPQMYITCENVSQDDKNLRIRVLTNNEEHMIAEGPEWSNEQAFCDFALQGIRQMLELDDEQPMQLS